MRTIFCDMDGVLSDFVAGYKLIVGRTPAEVRGSGEKGLYSMYWDTFLDAEGFTRLPQMPDALLLINCLNKLDIKKFNICILSSAGGFHRQREVAEQKMQWLADRDIYWPVVIVPGRRYKAGFARPDHIIIDDTRDVITDFEYAGGIGIHHVNADITLEQLDDHVRN